MSHRSRAFIRRILPLAGATLLVMSAAGWFLALTRVRPDGPGELFGAGALTSAAHAESWYLIDRTLGISRKRGGSPWFALVLVIHAAILAWTGLIAALMACLGSDSGYGVVYLVVLCLSAQINALGLIVMSD